MRLAVSGLRVEPRFCRLLNYVSKCLLSYTDFTWLSSPFAPENIAPFFTGHSVPAPDPGERPNSYKHTTSTRLIENQFVGFLPLSDSPKFPASNLREKAPLPRERGLG